MVSLVKGQKVSLSKTAPTLTNLVVGLGWDVKEGMGYSYDLDAFVIACRNNRLTNKDDLVYFMQPVGCKGAVRHGGDNLTGEGDGDDEQIFINLSKLSLKINKLIICVNIFQASKRNQDFGQVKNAYMRLCNDNEEIFRFNLSNDYSGYRGMIFGEIYRHNNEWKFNPIGEGTKEDSVEAIAKLYL